MSELLMKKSDYNHRLTTMIIIFKMSLIQKYLYKDIK